MESGSSTSNLKTTRLELINLRNRLKIANKGLDLLKMKRSSLVLEFFNIAKGLQSGRTDLVYKIENARNSLRLAEIEAGQINIHKYAYETDELGFVVNTNNVMGVIIQNLGIKNLNKDNSSSIFNKPLSIQDTQSKFFDLLTSLINMIDRERSMRKILNEIDKLNRRVNALENNIIPSLQFKINYIKQRLDDIEKDQIISLKFIKRKLHGSE